MCLNEYGGFTLNQTLPVLESLNAQASADNHKEDLAVLTLDLIEATMSWSAAADSHSASEIVERIKKIVVASSLT